VLETVAQGVITAGLVLAGIAMAWLVVDILFASPAILVFAEIAMICAALGPLACLAGWGMRWIGVRARA
jgi:hypothetical protein